MAKLPSGAMRLISLVEKSLNEMPPPVEVSLPPEVIDKLRSIDVQLAACYASMDDLGDRLEEITDEINLANRRRPASVEEFSLDDELAVGTVRGLDR